MRKRDDVVHVWSPPEGGDGERVISMKTFAGIPVILTTHGLYMIADVGSTLPPWRIVPFGEKGRPD
jgi:hypothetical protein